MKIIRYPQYRSLNDVSCVTIGNFDGVHLGHQKLIKHVVQKAKEHDALATVVTMQPLPLQYFKGQFSIDLLSDFKLKVKLFKALGVDVMCVLNFNQNLAGMTAEKFYRNILLQGLNSQYVLIGDDFRFGENRTGGYAELRQWGNVDGVVVEKMDSVIINHVRVSSSVIRDALAAGDFKQAKLLLGRDFNLVGRVVSGRQQGRELGFPTANIELKNGGFPLHGIYHTHIRIGQELLPSITSVGFNPTVGGNAKRVEVHIFDFDQDIYGETVEVLFYKKLRNEVEFGSLAELTQAIEADVKVGRDFFAR